MSAECSGVTEQLNGVLRLLQELQAEIAAAPSAELAKTVDSGVLDGISKEVDVLRGNITRALSHPGTSESPSTSRLNFIQCDDFSKLDVPTLRRLADHLSCLHLKARTNDDRRALLRDINTIKVEIFTGRKQPRWEEHERADEIPLPPGMAYAGAYQSYAESLTTDTPMEKPELFLDVTRYHVPGRIKVDQKRVEEVLNSLNVSSESGMLFALDRRDQERIEKEVDSYISRFRQGFGKIHEISGPYSSVANRLINFLEGQIEMLESREISHMMGSRKISDFAYSTLKARIIDPILKPEIMRLKQS